MVLLGLSAGYAPLKVNPDSSGGPSSLQIIEEVRVMVARGRGTKPAWPLRAPVSGGPHHSLFGVSSRNGVLGS